MPKLPGAEALGGLPSARSGRPIASVDTTAVGEGVARMGAGIAQGGRALSVAYDADNDEKRKEAEKAEAFRVKSDYLKFEQQWAQRFTEEATKVQLGADGFSDAYVAEFDKEAKKFFGTIPERLKPEYDLDLVSLRGKQETAATNFQREERARHSLTLVGEGQDAALQRIQNDPTAWQRADKDVEELTRNAPGVDPVTADIEIRKWRERRAAALFEIENERNPAGARAKLGIDPAPVPAAPVVPGSSQDMAAGILREMEGFRETPYWDVNANRIGYGSDTITLANGTVKKVTKETRVTKADAERDLARRVGEFQAVASKQVGANKWAALPAQIQAALTSVAYNYGDLPPDVVSAAIAGDQERIATAVEGLAGHNGGVNKHRREREAAIIRGNAQPAPEYADLSLEERRKLYDDSVALEVAREKTAQEQADASYAAYKDRMGLAILTGDVRDEKDILDSTLRDDDKTTLLRSLRTEREKTAVLEADREAYFGRSLDLNPLASEDRTRGDKLFESLLKGVPEELQPIVTGDFIERTGVVPKTVAAGVRKGILSTDPEEVAGSLTTAANIVQRAPLAIDAMENGGDIRDAAATYAHLTDDLGYSSDEAAQRVIAMRSDEARKTEAVLKPLADKFVKDELKPGDITSQFESRLPFDEPSAGFTPRLVEAMMADYREIARDKFMYAANGDAGSAKAMAIAEMKRLYGVTNVNGSATVMKFPPENFYPLVDGSHDYLREAALADAQSVAGGIGDRFVATPNPAGLIEKGNIDIYARPKVKNADGSISTVRSISFNMDGTEVLVPTVSDDGRIMADEEAIQTYRRTGRHLGKFASPEEATAYANALHDQQAEFYNSPRPKVTDIFIEATPQTNDDRRNGRLPTYRLYFATEENGQTVWNEAMKDGARQGFGFTQEQLRLLKDEKLKAADEKRKEVFERNERVQSGGYGLGDFSARKAAENIGKNFFNMPIGEDASKAELDARIEQALETARQSIAADPSQRKAVEDRLRASGIDPGRL